MNSTLVTLPRSFSGLFASNSAAKEWCADRGAAASATSRSVPGEAHGYFPAASSARASLSVLAIP